MSEKPSGPHDVRTIHLLVRLMKRYDLTAIDFVTESAKIRLRRQGMPPSPASAQGQASTSPPAATAPSTSPAPRSESQPPAAAREVVIESPMVGTFFSSNSPNAPPFVTVGSAVRPDTTVCIIEAMKVFTDIPAGVSGTVSEILAKNGQSVEFGQALFRVNPS